MPSYLNHDIIPRIEIFPEVLVKIRHSNVTCRHFPILSYIFPIYFHCNDVIYKSADISKDTDVMTKVDIANKTCYITL